MQEPKFAASVSRMIIRTGLILIFLQISKVNGTNVRRAASFVSTIEEKNTKNVRAKNNERVFSQNPITVDASLSNTFIFLNP